MDTPAQLHLGRSSGAPFLMPSGALTRHAVCFGATGSGKTALCLALLEEAALLRIPILALDPKGDVANLLLTFPGLPPARLAPWLDDALVRKLGGDRARAAELEAARWKEGLAAADVPLERLAALRDRVQIDLYTPGSDAGRPLAILGGLGPPATPRETWSDQARAAALALLTLAGVEIEAGRSREEALLTALLQHTWASGVEPTVPDLLAAIQRPPFARLGALDLETYYPEKARFDLVLSLNHLLATQPDLLEGAPLAIEELLGPPGSPRISVLSLAHLAEGARQAFVTALLGRLVGWMRHQPGQSAPRALLFLDEAAGYLPPVANPPPKGSLMTLFKQGRAQGLGVVVATQNPADIDYKALSNAGTWLVGRLATGRDRLRVKEALEGSDLGLDLEDLDGRLASLGPRQFFCHGFWAPPCVFEARWTLSYLRGPLALEELRRLKSTLATVAGAEERGGDVHPGSPPGLAGSSPGLAGSSPGLAGSSPGLADLSPGVEARATTASPLLGATAGPPLTPPGVKQLFALASPEDRTFVPRALALLRVGYQDRPRAIDGTFDLCLALPVPPGAAALDWSRARRLDLRGEDFSESPPEDGAFAAIPAGGLQAGSARAWQRALLAHLTQHELRRWWWCPATRTLSEEGEEEASFRGRLGPAAARAAEEALQALEASQEPKKRAAEERQRRAEQALARRKEQATQAKTNAALAAGAALLGGLLGGRGTGKKVVKVVQGATRAKHADSEADRAEETVESCREELARLREELTRQGAEARARLRPEVIPLERVELRPARGRVEVLYLGIGWLPGEPGPRG